MCARTSKHSSMHRHEHSRGPRPGFEARERRIYAAALALTAAFAVVEAIGGWWAGSLALLSDAGHMVTDVAALSIALLAQRLAQRPPSRRASYGYARAEVLAAFINALALLALVVFIVIEAVRRLLVPQPVAGGLLLGVACAGLLANLGTAWILSRAEGSLNQRGALLHVMSDVLGSAAAIVAGAVIVATGWAPIDPILSLAVSVLILRSSWRLLTESTGVLMERVPAHLSYEDIGRALARVPGIAAVHDLHVWHMSSDRAALSAHVLINEPDEWPPTLAAAQRLLAQRFGIDHVTIQPDWRTPVPGKRVIPVAPLSPDASRNMH